MGSLSQDFLLGFRSVFLAPWGIWQTWSWNESSTLKGTVRAHRQSYSQQPIFQPSSWPICNPLVCFVAAGSSWPLLHFPAFLGRTVAVLLRSETHKTQSSCPQATCGISSRTFHVLPIGVTNTWDHRGERAGQNITTNASHWEWLNCVNQSVLIRFSIGRSIHICLKWGSQFSQVHLSTLLTI